MGYVKKEELIQKLTALGADFQPTWTVPELRALYDELKPDVKKELKETPITGISKLDRAGLVQRCKEYNIQVSEHATMAQMETRLRALTRVLALPVDEDVIAWGKHNGETYHTVWKDRQKYAQWVITTSQEDPEASKDLLRLADYLKAKTQDPKPISKTHFVKTEPTAKAEKKETEAAKDNGKESASSSGENSERLTRLEERLTRLENMLMT